MNPKTRKNAAKKTRTYNEQRAREKVAGGLKNARKANAKHESILDNWGGIINMDSGKYKRSERRVEKAFDKSERINAKYEKRLDPRTKKKYNLL